MKTVPVSAMILFFGLEKLTQKSAYQEAEEKYYFNLNHGNKDAADTALKEMEKDETEKTNRQKENLPYIRLQFDKKKWPVKK